MSDTRYQVFVSSTYRDLHAERQEVIRALLELNCFPAGMELFPAADDDAWTLIKRVIDASDYYVVISAGRYGSAHPDSGVGYTEMEYDYAVETGKPVLAFLHGAPGALPLDASESDFAGREKLEAFRAKMRRKLVREWRTAEDLAGSISRSLIQTMAQRPGVGWVRAVGRASHAAELEIAALKEELATLKLELHRRTGPSRDFDAELDALAGDAMVSAELDLPRRDLYLCLLFFLFNDRNPLDDAGVLVGPLAAQGFCGLRRASDWEGPQVRRDVDLAMKRLEAAAFIHSEGFGAFKIDADARRWIALKAPFAAPENFRKSPLGDVETFLRA